MALKNICKVPTWWTIHEHAKHRCTDSSHGHISRAELKQYQDAGLVKFISEPTARILVVAIRPQFDETKYCKIPPSRQAQPEVHGLSAKVGEYMARAIGNSEPWAVAMLAEMNRPLPRSTEKLKSQGTNGIYRRNYRQQCAELAPLEA